MEFVYALPHHRRTTGVRLSISPNEITLGLNLRFAVASTTLAMRLCPSVAPCSLATAWYVLTRKPFYVTSRHQRRCCPLRSRASQRARHPVVRRRVRDPRWPDVVHNDSKVCIATLSSVISLLCEYRQYNVTATKANVTSGKTRGCWRYQVGSARGNRLARAWHALAWRNQDQAESPGEATARRISRIEHRVLDYAYVRMVSSGQRKEVVSSE